MPMRRAHCQDRPAASARACSTKIEQAAVGQILHPRQVRGVRAVVADVERVVVHLTSKGLAGKRSCRSALRRLVCRILQPGRRPGETASPSRATESQRDVASDLQIQKRSGRLFHVYACAFGNHLRPEPRRLATQALLCIALAEAGTCSSRAGVISSAACGCRRRHRAPPWYGRSSQAPSVDSSLSTASARA